MPTAALLVSVLDARSISVKRAYRQYEELSSMITPQVVQKIVTNISPNWRYFRLRVFLIIEPSDNRSMSILTSQWRHMSATASELIGDLIVCSTACSIQRQNNIKEPHYGWIPSKRAGNVEIQSASES